MPFFTDADTHPVELFPGTTSRLINGEKVMLSWLEMQQGAVIPEHHHHHEQAGLVVVGELVFRIGDEERVLGPGNMFLVPADTPHSGEVTRGPARVLDVFSPPREEYVAKRDGPA